MPQRHKREFTTQGIVNWQKLEEAYAKQWVDSVDICIRAKYDDLFYLFIHYL